MVSVVLIAQLENFGTKHLKFKTNIDVYLMTVQNMFHFLFKMPLTERASTQLLLLMYRKEYVRKKGNEIGSPSRK